MKVLKYAMLALLAGLPSILLAQGPQANGRVVSATYIESEIVIDGHLTETVWETAQPAKDFTQKEPSEGKPASEWTEVRVLFDDRNLYIGVFCHDQNPDGIVVRNISRDFVATDQDVFGIVLDTFNDRRNGFVLTTTPAGGQRDVQFFNESRDENVNWDGVWYVEARMQQDGWVAEFAIPFNTLRFSKEDFQVWGVNFFRRIRRRNEFNSWTPLPRRYDEYQVSWAGELRAFENLRPGRNLKVKPFGLLGMNQFPSRGKGTEGDFDGGVDVKYGLTSGLTLDLSLNTDFSQVEADTQQINLTRFSLFFPEKREFFLENAGLFRLGQNYQSGPPRTNEAILFFSRRIGLTENDRGETVPIPILGGARLTGRAGPYYLGFMNIQTRSQDRTPANNFAVTRVRRDILANSDLGVIFINRQSRQPNDHNRLWGADANFRFFGNLQFNTVFAKTQTPGRPGDDQFKQVETMWLGDFFRFLVSYLDIQKNFKPEAGYIRRPGRRILHANTGLRYSLDRETRLGSLFRYIEPLLQLEYAILPDGTTESKYLRAESHNTLQDGGTFHVEYIRNFERLHERFPIRRSTTNPVAILPGDYKFNELTIYYNSDLSKVLSGRIEYRTGDFYSGEKKTLVLRSNVRPGYRFSTGVDYERNNIQLREGSFATDLVTMRVAYSFNPRMFLNALIQYNSDTNQVSSNIRFRLIHRPLSDLFIVYNEQRDNQRDLTDRTITLKYTYLFDF